MSVFGVDLGAMYSSVGITRHGGVDVIMNEVSKRETATYVSLTDEERCIGESGLDRSVRNLTNTIPNIKHFIGMREDDADFASEKRFLFTRTTTDEQGKIKFVVDYQGEETELYPEQVLAMYIGQLRKYVNIAATVDSRFPADVRDCVLTVPPEFTADQRKLVMQACEMANVNCLSLINDATASATEYGIFRGSSLPEKEEDAQVVVIVDCGYGSATASVYKFWKGNLKVLGRVCDKEVACREIDYLLYKHFTSEIEKKYKIDLSENKRARVRVLQAVNKVKQVLSANQCSPLNIENLMDIDINIPSFTRDELVEIIAPLLSKFEDMLNLLVAETPELDVSKIHSVEMIGGGCRIPAFKAACEKVFEKAPSFTLNASETVARGAAVVAAMFSPKFQVREFIVHERPPLPILAGHANPACDKEATCSFLPGVNDVVTLLGANEHYPKVLDVAVKRTDEFTFHAFYDETSPEAKNFNTARMRIGEWKIGTTAKNTDGTVKIRVRLLPNGLIQVDGAYTNEIVEVEEKLPAVGDAEPEVTKKTKKHRIELTCTPVQILGHSAETVIACRKIEDSMLAADNKILYAKEIKNTLESYIFENRRHVEEGGRYFEFAPEADRKKFIELSGEFENWIYEDGADASVEEYLTRIKQLKDLAEPAAARHTLFDDAPFSLKVFIDRVDAVKGNVAKKIAEKPSHITTEEFQGAIAKCDEAVKAAEAAVAALLASPKHIDSSFKLSDFDAKLTEVTIACNTVINKPKPKPKAEEKPKEAAPKAEEPAAPAADDSVPPPPPQQKAEDDLD